MTMSDRTLFRSPDTAERLDTIGVNGTAGPHARAMFEDMAAKLGPGDLTEELVPTLVRVTARHGLELLVPTG
jgi:hypothetical protein